VISEVSYGSYSDQWWRAVVNGPCTGESGAHAVAAREHVGMLERRKPSAPSDHGTRNLDNGLDHDQHDDLDRCVAGERVVTGYFSTRATRSQLDRDDELVVELHRDSL
jgi:hypothetical protein